MAPFIVLILSFLILRITGVLGILYFDRWDTSLRVAVALMFLLTATAHWGKRRPDLIKMVPQGVPNPEFIVTITGILEIVGAIGLLIPLTSRITSIGLALLLIFSFQLIFMLQEKELHLAENLVLLYFLEQSYKSYF
ncbi:DoxX family protein [Bacillus sp. OTU2372]|uniref:DoxX family protein n=1 Tax=Bacillus sp. OTU2372 TaxID=3043858 RepID=UPI00313C1BAF